MGMNSPHNSTNLKKLGLAGRIFPTVLLLFIISAGCAAFGQTTSPPLLEIARPIRPATPSTTLLR